MQIRWLQTKIVFLRGLVQCCTHTADSAVTVLLLHALVHLNCSAACASRPGRNCWRSFTTERSSTCSTADLHHMWPQTAAKSMQKWDNKLVEYMALGFNNIQLFCIGCPMKYETFSSKKLSCKAKLIHVN